MKYIFLTIAILVSTNIKSQDIMCRDIELSTSRAKVSLTNYYYENSSSLSRNFAYSVVQLKYIAADTYDTLQIVKERICDGLGEISTDLFLSDEPIGWVDYEKIDSISFESDTLSPTIDGIKIEYYCAKK